MDFVFTSDVDWASESAIDRLLSILSRYGIMATFFATHESAALKKAAAAGRIELGIHPNFLPGSTHGDDVDSVIQHVLKIVPGALMARCHAYLDGSHIAAALVRHGVRIDSNLCLHLQRGLGPLRHWSGLLRLPVFFEDDVHWLRGGSWDFRQYASQFFSAGIKVLNFHPFFVALNVPSAEFYTRHKQHVPTLTNEQAAVIRFEGPGAETFLVQTLEAVLAAGHRFVPLSALAHESEFRHAS